MFFIDLTGRTFGRLTVISQIPSKNDRKPLKWICECSCGGNRTVAGVNLRSGATTGCKDCWRADIGARFRKHKKEDGPTYTSWHSMMGRSAYTNNTTTSRDYQDRGITVCKRWLKFENFLSDMGRRPPGKTIERTNNDKSYTPSNCVWATPKEQAQNRRPRRDRPMLTYKGKTHDYVTWSKLTGIAKYTLIQRTAAGWSAKDTITLPARRSNRWVRRNG